MEKENGIPPSRRRPAGSDGPAPTALATQGESAADDPAGGDTGDGRDEEELAGGRPGGKRDGKAQAEAGPGPRAPQGRPVASPALPQRVRGMSDGPRPPAQVARPVLPPSFLERVRAAAEAEQRLEQRAQEEARQPAEPEPPAARPAEPRRPPRFVRSRDWIARSGDKKERARGDQAGPGPQRGTAGDQLRPAREGLAGNGNDAAEPGPTVVLPRRGPRRRSPRHRCRRMRRPSPFPLSGCRRPVSRCRRRTWAAGFRRRTPPQRRMRLGHPARGPPRPRRARLRPGRPAVTRLRPGRPAVTRLRPGRPAVTRLRPDGPAVTRLRPDGPAVTRLRPGRPPPRMLAPRRRPPPGRAPPPSRMLRKPLSRPPTGRRPAARPSRPRTAARRTRPRSSGPPRCWPGSLPPAGTAAWSAWPPPSSSSSAG